MAKRDKLLARLMAGASDANIRFAELRKLLRGLGFDERIRGDHHIFSKSGVEEILNLQPRNAMAKPYQVKQVRRVVLRHNLGGEDVEQV